MKKTNINRYIHKRNSNVGLGIGIKIFKSIALIAFFNLIIFIFIFGAYILSIASDRVEYDVKAGKLNLTSVIYSKDDNGNFKEYSKVYNTENRIWVAYQDISPYMKDAIISIEDKHFFDHKGVDFFRTFKATGNLLIGGKSYGGSTLTQQLVKNLTGESEVSIVRKVKEIFRALNFEKENSKDEIIEAYLNVVNFGCGCRGVQAASMLYFNKPIKDCSIAQCAAIAGITQNPTAYNPYLHPENNQKRRETVISEMYNQGRITKDQYNEAMEESKHMEFVKSKNSNQENYNVPVRDWYTEAMINDIIRDLMEKYKISKASAQEILFTQGLSIYSAVDPKAQRIAEEVISDSSIMPKDKKLELGYMMMDFDGRVLASIGSRAKKTGNLWFDRANAAKRQPGSCIKPIAAYAPAIDLGLYNYSSIIKDEPLPNFYGTGNPGPNNWYPGYKGDVTLQWAIQQSANAPVAQVLEKLTYQKSFDFLTQKLGFTNLDIADKSSKSGLSLGGLHTGVTVREMTAAFQIFGNGGIYNKPYMYFYVADRNGKILLDNRNKIGSRAISAKTATIMNRLLKTVVDEGTGKAAKIEGVDVYGKTGTTNNNKDSWFIGATPHAAAGIWTGFDSPKKISETACSKYIWREIMKKYIDGKKEKTYVFDESVKEYAYCRETGQIAVAGICPDTCIGYYSKDNMPPLCTKHTGISGISSNREYNDNKVLNQHILEDEIFND